METLAGVAAEIARLTGVGCRPEPEETVAGGSINRCYRWVSGAGPLFVKVGAREALPMFEAESAGLAELAAARALRVPGVVACGSRGTHAFLALEWLEQTAVTEACEERLGRGLAALHRVTRREFGWHRDNTIGSTPQANGPLGGWAEFFRERRLRPQLALAASRGFAELLAPAGERLLEAVEALLEGHRPAASLLHGDLWGGNWLATAGGEPAVFDPAVYYGDRETDLAMSRLFGGFGPAFYQAYAAEAPLPPGAELRRELYNLYHVLNHANLFGGSYAQRARALIDGLLARVRP
ncbi:MAG TPA: fructosamine kinase family protein [Steroidobacteraceae bacterium]|jgi:fructosamine-3-kinase|nr:fructosamine kinase family protein [Steroidobacteraceae bacterium]